MHLFLSFIPDSAVLCFSVGLKPGKRIDQSSVAKPSSSSTKGAFHRDGGTVSATAEPSGDADGSSRDEKWREELAEMRRRNAEGRSARTTEGLGAQVTGLWREMKKKQQADPSAASRLAHRLGAPKTIAEPAEGEAEPAAKFSSKDNLAPRLAHRLGAPKTTELAEEEAEAADKKSGQASVASNDRPEAEVTMSAAESAKRAARAARFATKSSTDAGQIESRVPTQAEVLAAFRDKMMSSSSTFDKFAPVTRTIAYVVALFRVV